MRTSSYSYLTQTSKVWYSVLLLIGTMAPRIRTSHMRSNDKDSGNKTAELPFDVQSKFEEMDKNLDLINHNKRAANSGCSNMANGGKTAHILYATATGNTDGAKKVISQYKIIPRSRKYPLMEKCQKSFKRLGHNRSIPKRRAHTVSLSELPNEDVKIKSPKSLKDKKDQLKQKRITKKKDTERKLQTVASIEESPQEDIVSDNISENSVLQNVKQSSETSKSYFNARSSSDTFHSNDLNRSNNNLSSQQSTKDEYSNVDSTEIEYEKFINDNKINIEEVPKKKLFKRKRSMPNRVHKHPRESISIENVPEYCNSNFQDICANTIEVESNEDKYEIIASENVQCEENNKIKLKRVSSRKSKPRRKSISIENVPEDYHLSKNFSDRNCQGTFRNISEETLGALDDDKSETVTLLTFSNECVNSRIELKPNNCHEHIIKESHKSDIAESERITDSSKTEIDKNSGDSNIISTIQNYCPYLKNSVLELNAINLKKGISRKDTVRLETRNTAHDLPFNTPNSSNVKYSLTSIYQGSNNETSSEDGDVIDLCDNDAEGEKTETTQHSRSLPQKQNGLEHCEIQRFTPIEVDSDIEIIDIKPISNSEKIPNSKKIIRSNLENSKNCNMCKEEKLCNEDNNYKEHSVASVISHVKTSGEMETESFTSDENVNDVPLPVIANVEEKKTKNIELRRKMCENNSSVYMKDICKVFTPYENNANASYEHMDNPLISVNSSITQSQRNRLHVTEGTEFNANYQSCANDAVKNEVKGEEHIRAVDSVSVKGENVVDNPERKIEKCSELNRKNSYFYSTCNSADVNAQNNFSTNLNPQTSYSRDASGSKSPIERALCDENSKIPEVNSLLDKYKIHYEAYQNIIMAQKDFRTMTEYLEQQEGNIMMTQKSLETRLEFLEQQERNTLLAILTKLRDLL